MNIGIWQLVILALVVLVLFGRGRISEMMGDFGKGIKSFKQGMNEETERPVTMPPRLEQAPAEPAVPTPAAVPHPAQGAAPVQGNRAPPAQGQAMSYDPVTAPPSTDPNPPHPAPAPSAPQGRAAEMPYDPVTAPPGAGDGNRRAG